MIYTLNDYCKLVFSNPGAPRVIVYSNNTVAAGLLNHHKSNGAEVVSVADCIAAGAIRLPMPDALMSNLDAIIQSRNGRIVVVGIDSYLSLLSADNMTAFFVALRGRIDDGKLNAAYMVSDRHNLHFDNPRYEESLDVIKVGGDFEHIETPKVEVVSDKWVKTGNLTDYHDLLKQLGDFLPRGNYTLVLKDLGSKQAGLGKNVSFILDVRHIAERFYGISADLKSATMELLLSKVKESGETPESYIETEFGKTNINIRLALKRLHELPDDDLWAAYVWLLRKQLPADTYLAKVLSSDVTFGALLRKYVVDTAVAVLDDNNARNFAAERSEALTGITAESLIVEFIGHTKEIESAAWFLNCGTAAERIEIIRRASKLDLVTGLPELYKRLYPALADYLSTGFDYGTNELTEYFKEYRKLKITNTVTETFVSRAFETVLPKAHTSRESLLADLRVNGNTALLVVDGMGAEYFPLLIAMAKRRGMNIESYAVAAAKLPTSTEFNHITWDNRHTLAEIREIDTINHYGAAKNENNTPEKNIEKTLGVFDEVFNRIATGLDQYGRVVVTADHGSSRLAVLAHNKGFGTNLPWDGQPLDWRYSFAPANRERPPEFEQQYHPDSGKTYWIVRGYNRLPKSGGKPNELHGGASIEERLVPVVVFTKTESAMQPKQPVKKVAEQIVDRMSLDI